MSKIEFRVFNRPNRMLALQGKTTPYDKNGTPLETIYLLTNGETITESEYLQKKDYYERMIDNLIFTAGKFKVVFDDLENNALAKKRVEFYKKSNFVVQYNEFGEQINFNCQSPNFAWITFIDVSEENKKKMNLADLKTDYLIYLRSLNEIETKCLATVLNVYDDDYLTLKGNLYQKGELDLKHTIDTINKPIVELQARTLFALCVDAGIITLREGVYYRDNNTIIGSSVEDIVARLLSVADLRNSLQAKLLDAYPDYFDTTTNEICIKPFSSDSLKSIETPKTATESRKGRQAKS